MDQSVEEEFTKLKEIFLSMGKVVVAYSGGVDSTLLLRVAKESLREENIVAVTAL